MITIGVDIRVLGTGRISGVEEYTEQLLEHLTAMPSDIRWKFFYSGRTPLRRRRWMERPNTEIHEFRVPNRLLWLSTRVFGVPYLDRLVGGADAFFFPHFLLGEVTPECRRIVTWHDLSYERMPYLLTLYRRFWHAVQMQPRKQAFSADRVCAVSVSTADDLVREYGIARERITVIHSGIDPSLRRASEPNILRWRRETGIDAPFVLALGTMEPRKNLPGLIRAWDVMRKDDAFRDVHLVIAGAPGWRTGEVKRAISEVNKPDAIHIIGPVGHSDRSVVLSAAALLAYPSFMEGFGFPPLEAMACGTPVVASATSALIETVGDAGILVNPYRTDELADSMAALLSDPGLRSRYVARGFERARRFTWRTAATSTLEMLRSVLAQDADGILDGYADTSR